MERIVRVHHPGLDERLLDLAMQAFYWLRDVPGLRKKPSTSELIDWVRRCSGAACATRTSSRAALHRRAAQEGPRRRRRRRGAARRPRPALGAGDARREPVNVDYLLLLLLPSVVAVVLVALTWRSRVKRQRAAEDEQRRRAAKSGRSAARRLREVRRAPPRSPRLRQAGVAPRTKRPTR